MLKNVACIYSITFKSSLMDEIGATAESVLLAPGISPGHENENLPTQFTCV